MKVIRFFIIVALCAISGNLKAQDLAVAPAHLLCDYNVPEKLDNQVKSKLTRALTAYGIGSDSDMARFAMVPQVVINSEETTATTPVYCNVDFDLVITLQDVYTAKNFATYTVSGQSTGTNKANAIAKGVSSIKLSGPDFVSFCENAKGKIIDYYTANMNSIMAAASAAEKSRDYDQALGILAEIPEEVKDFDTKVAPLMQKFYTNKTNLEGETILNEARAAWTESPDEAGAEKVADILSKIPANCSASAGAKSLMDQVRKRVQALNDRQFEFENSRLTTNMLLRSRHSRMHMLKECRLSVLQELSA